MAKRYKIGWECGECFAQASSQDEAAKCHNLPEKIFICEICEEEHVCVEDAIACCATVVKTADLLAAGAQIGIDPSKGCDRAVPDECETVLNKFEFPAPGAEHPYIPHALAVETPLISEDHDDEVSDVHQEPEEIKISELEKPKPPIMIEEPPPKLEPRLHELPFPPKKLGPVDPNCPECGTAQKVGTVAYCRCMRTHEEDPEAE